MGTGEPSGSGISASGYRVRVGEMEILIPLSFVSVELLLVEASVRTSARGWSLAGGSCVLICNGDVRSIGGGGDVAGGESGRGVDVGERTAFATCCCGLGEGACEGLGVDEPDKSPIAKDALSLSSSAGFDTGLSSRSGCGEVLVARADSAEGETAVNGRCDASDLRKLLSADSAR